MRARATTAGCAGPSVTIDHLRARRRAAAHSQPAMRSIGHSGRWALFLGAGDSFEIWNPDLALKCATTRSGISPPIGFHAHGAFGVHLR
jgi:hypothetical protein